MTTPPSEFPSLKHGTVYLVGGAVRDEYLGRPITERDWVVVGATPEEMLRQGFLQVGKDFPVFLHPLTKEEYALARREKKTGRGYQGFSFDTSTTVTLEEDLKRRDITINAMAKNAEGVLIDPYGGLKDLKSRQLRHVSDAFVEDPLRVLRVARFAGRYFHRGFFIAPETLELMKQLVGEEELSYLSPERIWQETHTALSETHPRIYFEVLRNCGALEVLFPEIAALYGVPNPLRWHPEIDTGVHTMMVLDAAVKLSKRPVVRFAALLHDLGKGKTPSSLWPRHIGHEKEGELLVKNVCDRLRVPKEFKELALLVAKEHGMCHQISEMKPSTLIRTLERFDVYRRPERFQDFLMACTADHEGRTGYQGKPYAQADAWQSLYEKTKTVDMTPLLEKNLKGEAMAAAVFEARVALAKAWKETSNFSS